MNKQQCIKLCKNKVCDRCWLQIVPIKTVDNIWNDTYWSWCYHWNDDNCWHFTQWVSKEIFELALNLILDDSCDFRINDWYNFKDELEEATKRACDIIQKIEYMKINKNPRHTKGRLEEDFNKYKIKWKE